MAGVVDRPYDYLQNEYDRKEGDANFAALMGTSLSPKHRHRNRKACKANRPGGSYLVKELELENAQQEGQIEMLQREVAQLREWKTRAVDHFAENAPKRNKIIIAQEKTRKRLQKIERIEKSVETKQGTNSVNSLTEYNEVEN